MEITNDWRLTNQIHYLNNKRLKYVNFQKYSIKWEHEHCEFCFERFDNANQVGYCTLDDYYWICQKCFNDFKNIFNWTIANI